MPSIQIRKELLKYVSRIIGNIPEVEDIVQESILISLEKGETLNDIDKYKQWLFRIARNKSLDFLKSQKKFIKEASHKEYFDAYLEARNTLLTLAENNKDTYDKVREFYLVQNKSAKEIRQYLISVYSDASIVSDKQVEVMLLSELRQFSLQEIADILKIPLPTAKSRVQRAKQKAKEVFFKCCKFEFDSRGNVMDYELQK